MGRSWVGQLGGEEIQEVIGKHSCLESGYTVKKSEGVGGRSTQRVSSLLWSRESGPDPRSIKSKSRGRSDSPRSRLAPVPCQRQQFHSQRPSRVTTTHESSKHGAVRVIQPGRGVPRSCDETSPARNITANHQKAPKVLRMSFSPWFHRARVCPWGHPGSVPSWGEPIASLACLGRRKEVSLGGLHGKAHVPCL